MATLEELEQRLAALEERVAAIREDAAAARVLAGGADRDVTRFGETLGAHTRVLNALRETQLEQGTELTAVAGRVDALSGRVDALSDRVDEGFGKLTVGMTGISRLLRGLIERDE